VVNVFVEFRELGYIYFYGAGVLLFQHVPEFLGFIFEDVW
jgi:hypothetical protein